MSILWKGIPLAAAAMLSACVAVPVGTPPAQQLVAVPGPNRTQAQYAQDDAACRALADKPAAATNAQPIDPAGVYFSCMTSRGDTISSGPAYPAGYQVAAAYPVGVPYGAIVSPYLYAGFPAYGFYDDYFLNRGVGYYGPFGFGFYGGYGYRGYGYGRGYAYNGFREGGYRGGYGGGGFGGGYRGGGGFHR